MSLSKDSQFHKFYDSSTPTVSVIMNCLNCEKYLREAIDSVFAQTYEDWEIIFWEDKASEDNSENIAKSYGSKLRYFRSDVSLPLYGSRNLAVQKARGKYIAILDCDDLWLPAKLEEQIPLLERDVAIGLVYSDVFEFNEKGKEKRLFEYARPCRGNIFSELLKLNFINTQTVVIRRDAFGSIDNPFDASFILAGDYDTYLRISYKWKIDYVNKPLARYRIHRNSKTWKDGRKLLTVELGLIVENLNQVDCEIEEKFPVGIRALKRFRDVQLSLVDWENGDKKRARERLRIYVHDSIVYLILYFLVYFPYRYVYYPCYLVHTKGIKAS
ncbi:MAG: glycosyltransferase [Candidatus Brocadiaceae bacterium]|nr:glycosyltransferase [Candidatus Brocadiaceae bacterium]